MSKLIQNNIKRVVVRGTNWVGDAVISIGALRKLRVLLPGAHITLVSRSWAKGLFEGVDFVDELLTTNGGGVAGTLSEIREWAKRDFDLAVIFPNSFATALVPALARIPYRIGYATERRGFLLTHPLALPEWRESRHEAFYYLNIVSELERAITGQVESTEPDWHLTASQNSKTAARTILNRHGVADTDLVIALCPGSINSRAKRWPAENYAALGDLLSESVNAKVLLIGSAAEAAVTSEVQGGMSRKAIPLTGETSLEELVGVLSRVDLLITNDTGPAHIASALGRPTLVIFGPTNPLTTRPFSELAQIVRKPPDCAPCMLRDCPIDHRCMTAITPEDVFQRAISMVSVPVAHNNEVVRAR